MLPLAIALTNFTVHFVILPWTMIDHEVSKESLSWPTVCKIENASVRSIPSPINESLSKAEKGFLSISKPDRSNSYGTINATDCLVKMVTFARLERVSRI